MKTVQLLIKGKVQGVFYRVSAKETADKLGIKGWVRNTEAGDVETMISGEEAVVEAFIQWCRKGPSKAQVTHIIVSEKAFQAFTDFAIQR